MKSEFKRIKEEVSEAVQSVISSEEERQRQEEKSRKQYESAKKEMSAALAAGDKDGYKTAGMKAEEARLELEFFEKRKETEKEPKATREDDFRVQAALNLEAKRITTDFYMKLIPIFNEAALVSKEARQNMNEINTINDSWKRKVMKENTYSKIGSDYMIGIDQIINMIKAHLTRFEEIKTKGI